MINSENESLLEELEKREFFQKKIEFSSRILEFDRSPICVNLHTYLSKIHYLFLQLGIFTVYVVENSQLMGIINKSDFLRLNK